MTSSIRVPAPGRDRTFNRPRVGQRLLGNAEQHGLRARTEARSDTSHDHLHPAILGDVGRVLAKGVHQAAVLEDGGGQLAQQGAEAAHLAPDAFLNSAEVLDVQRLTGLDPLDQGLHPVVEGGEGLDRAVVEVGGQAGRLALCGADHSLQ
jgi:hypothetical protein